MLFFLMLFAMTRMSTEDKAKVSAGIQSTVVSRSAREEAGKDRLMKQQKEAEAVQGIQRAISDGTLAGSAQVTVDAKTVKITLNPTAFFTTGSATISQDTLKALEDLVEPIRAFPDDIIIEGHTDNVPVRGGAFRSNWELSVARAVSVINFFTSKGLDPRRMIAGGYGEYHPAYPNDSEENRAKNRRIEITILRQPGGNK
jgi:chemotaxis protein MotB